MKARHILFGMGVVLGLFLTSTFYSESFMSGLYVDTSTINPQDGSLRYRGFSIRCVLK